MRLTKTAVFLKLDTVGSRLFIFTGHVITPFAFCTGQGNVYPHYRHLPASIFSPIKEALN